MEVQISTTAIFVLAWIFHLIVESDTHRSLADPADLQVWPAR